MTHYLRIFLNFSFVITLFLPLVVFVISPVKDISQSEKRKLAVFPKIESRVFSLRDFSKQIELYWNDHFGFRENLVALNATIQGELFNKSPVKAVIQGNDGWLYFNLPSVISDYLGIDHPPENTLHDWTTTLENREKWLQKHNIHYLLVPVPSKMNIYPEFLPARYSLFRQGNGVNTLDLLFRYLEMNSSFSSIVALKPIYHKEKGKNQIYYKTDTHWTAYGAYLAYVEIIKKMNYWYPDLQIIPASSLKNVRKKRRGDLAIMTGSKLIRSEKSNHIRIHNSCFDKMFKLPNHNPSTTQRHPMVTTCDKAELTAVVSHDSFGPDLIPFLSQHFSRVIYVSMKDFDWLKEFLIKEKPDVFIHQQTARQMKEMLSDSWNLPENQ